MSIKTLACRAQAQRQFFTLPNILSSTKTYSERKLLNFSQNELYKVVSNVDDYHLFIPFCTHSHVYSTSPTKQGNRTFDVMKAELGVGFKLFEEKYMSKVTCDKPRLVKAEAADATLFKDMTTVWEFNPNVRKDTADLVAAADHPTCWVDFNITFEFASPIHAQASSVFFDEVSKMMLRAFINRCHEVYRK